jgi:ATP-dependent Clp protease adaptor protein ClpS
MSASTETIAEVETEEKIDVTEPNLWNVLFHNDDKTSMHFVVAVLVEIFHKSLEDSMEIMLTVHNNGKAIVGSYTHEIAEDKMNATITAAQTHGFPLKVTIEQQK